jgi:hypothetical protein
VDRQRAHTKQAGTRAAVHRGWRRVRAPLRAYDDDSGGESGPAIATETAVPAHCAHAVRDVVVNNSRPAQAWAPRVCGRRPLRVRSSCAAIAGLRSHQTRLTAPVRIATAEHACSSAARFRVLRARALSASVPVSAPRFRWSRYFTPREVANIHPKPNQLPRRSPSNSSATRGLRARLPNPTPPLLFTAERRPAPSCNRYALLGNGISVTVVTTLLRYLLCDDEPS